MENVTVQPIEKEDIPRLQFIEHEVLPGTVFMDKRKQLLFQSMILGNTCHAKVKIIFETTTGYYEVETTVWATTDDFVLLKGGVYLPMKCIHDVIIP
jgi:hypothetical protein